MRLCTAKQATTPGFDGSPAAKYSMEYIAFGVHTSAYFDKMNCAGGELFKKFSVARLIYVWKIYET